MSESSHGSGRSESAGPTGADGPRDDVLSNLPHSRPGRQSARRQALRARPPEKAAPPRPVPTAAAPAGPGRAPGLPRLALDGAIEIAKMPAKVGANVTLRALDAVVKGLRRQ